MSRTGWRSIAVILAGAFVAAAVTGTGSASRAGKVYTLSVGDGLVIVGSKIQCGVAADSGYGLDLRGKMYVVCGPSTQVRVGAMWP